MSKSLCVLNYLYTTSIIIDIIKTILHPICNCRKIKSWYQPPKKRDRLANLGLRMATSQTNIASKPSLIVAVGSCFSWFDAVYTRPQMLYFKASILATSEEKWFILFSDSASPTHQKCWPGQTKRVSCEQEVNKNEHSFNRYYLYWTNLSA